MIGAVLALLAAPPNYEVQWTAPKVFVEGRPFPVHVEFKATKDGAIPAWMLQPSGFRIDGKPIEDKQAKGDIEFGAGASLVLDLDLREQIAASKSFKKGDFKLSLEGSDTKPVDVRFFVPAPKGLDFLDEKKTAPEALSKYFVLLETNRGNMVAEFWPEVAPRHVRNYLDLCYTGFYDGVLFHRVWPGFMIQGGDPKTKDAKAASEWGTGSGPRTLKSEFNAKKHTRGVLSMARGGDPNSASCQFFVMHAAAPDLDGKYSAFGTLIDGLDTLDKIVTAPGKTLETGTIRPNDPQKIEHAVVLVAP
jgi:peptidyl-prolyl cis-trans isomerase B (cyclophilin B)